MPQTSPMNWIMISISLFFLCNSIMILTKKSNNMMKKTIKKIQNKNMTWKW
uniref:ATP synthase F0 subunit 8 n=1 Tax=Lebertia trifurcilla TaxID=450597 RepID=UPI002113944C|nr:ATP synthase F0 subunit 8 [Lebertia trifurcilla]UTE89508.1 ATP synthase F0 subunit 8 [Lebertia trifurcilla]